MTVVSVTYAKQSGSFFDLDYYLHKHVPMVKTVLASMGLQDLRLLRGAESITGAAPHYEMIALLTFEDVAATRSALGQHGAQIVDDIPNFTDIKPSMQINELLEENGERK